MQNKLIRQLITLSNTSERMTAAVCALNKFTKRKARLEHPDGSFDNASRFYPSDEVGTRWASPGTPQPLAA